MGVNNVIGNGLIRRSRITSNKKIQVNLLTGDFCAGYETRSYTLLPVDRWSNQYYNPVGSLTADDGPGPNHARPSSPVNPEPARLPSTTIRHGRRLHRSVCQLNTTSTVQMLDATGARFYTTDNPLSSRSAPWIGECPPAPITTVTATIGAITLVP